MKDTGEKPLLADISRELAAVLSCAKIISGETDSGAVKEYALKIKTAADRVLGMIDAAQSRSAKEQAFPERFTYDIGEAFDDSTPPVLIVDDDEFILENAQAILGRVYHTVAAKSGEEALSLLSGGEVSLVLLDINMPGMDGFETLERIRRLPSAASLPVVFLTGTESRDTEIRCFQAGASDFVRKPFVSQVLIERVRRIIELDKLQRDLSREVAAQTRRAVHLSREIMLALSKAVDAKDHYTNGHSRRVAEYSAEIARRMGKSKSEQEDIYAMGLLHDVGKIGVSEAIINKTSRLTDEEYAQIKTHTTIGYGILKIITEIPGLATGARWHHERYDGRGYPDGLSGRDIPEEARIICVADCYDAMTSNRSYSTVREQAAVRAEIIRCSGTQFDPDIAGIMISMIDDDPDYLMSERQAHKTQETAFAAPPPEPAEPPKPVKSVAGPVRLSDEDIQKAAVKRFYELLPLKIKKIEAAFGDFASKGSAAADAYRIEVHSLKSTSAMVGLDEISRVSAQLEKLAKDGDTEGISSLQPRYAGLLREALENGHGTNEGSAQETRKKEDGEKLLPELLGMLKLHMEYMDVDAADGVMKLILSYSYDERISAALGELKTAVLALDEDEVSRIAGEILK